MWKNEKFTLTKKIFRQINYFAISLVNALLSRNFCQKSVRVNFCNFHTVYLQPSFILKKLTFWRFVRTSVKLNSILNWIVINFTKILWRFSILCENYVKWTWRYLNPIEIPKNDFTNFFSGCSETYSRKIHVHVEMQFVWFSWFHDSRFILIIFQSLGFCVKSNLGILEVQDLPFLQFWRLRNLILLNFCYFWGLNYIQNQNSESQLINVQNGTFSVFKMTKIDYT